MKITMPSKAAYIISKLQSRGYDAYIVGGCVRDSLLGNEPADWDITTSAKPEQVKALFPRTIDTGIKHGTVTVMMDKEPYEVTTYRIDGCYEDHRHPSQVTFTRDLREDLMRRDFTINAMAYNDTDGLVDLFGGAEDLHRRKIRCVGSAQERFDEDALRMLRAVRFSGQLNFEIEDDTLHAIEEKYPLLAEVSAERIRMELMKLLVSRHPDYLRYAWSTGLTSIFLPEFDRMMETVQNNPHHSYNVGEHTLHALLAVKDNPILRLTILLHDVGKPDTYSTDEEGIDHFKGHNEKGAVMAEQILKRLKFDNRTIDIVTTLIANHDIRFNRPLTTGRSHVRKTISRVGVDLFPYLLDVMEADISAQSDYMRLYKLTALKETRLAYQEILQEQNCLTLKDLAINGNDLKALGISEGRMIGTILHALLNLVLEHPEHNNYEYLSELAMEIYKEISKS